MEIENQRFIGYTERLEKLQRRVIKIPTKLSKTSYDQWLAKLCLKCFKDKIVKEET